MADKIDILAFAAHPDDVELAASGTLLKHKELGYKIGIIDLTKGELGSRGTAELRKKESADSSVILGLDTRENLGLPDGFFKNDTDSKMKIIECIRKYQPSIILANSLSDRHPDHGRAGLLVQESCFLSGLRKIETFENGEVQKPHRPDHVFHYIQDNYLEPDFVVDISSHYETKMKSIAAFSSQFFSSKQKKQEPKTPISGEDFIKFLEGRARQFGRVARCEFGEGFVSSEGFGVKNLFELQ